MNRREFAYVTALAGWFAASAKESTKIPEGAGLITEMVFLDDSVRLAMYDPEIPKTVKSALTAFPDYVHNGTLAPSTVDTTSPEGLALHAGNRCSEALHRHRQPASPEARLYQDIGVMHDLAATAGRTPAKPGPVADLLDVLHVRRRLGLHTLNPDDDIHNWLEGIVTWWRTQRDLRAALAAAYTAPDQTRMREYVADFYNPSDPIIRLARDFQFGEVAPQDAFVPALNRGRQGSGYVRALVSAVESLHKPMGER